MAKFIAFVKSTEGMRITESIEQIRHKLAFFREEANNEFDSSYQCYNLKRCWVQDVTIITVVLVYITKNIDIITSPLLAHLTILTKSVKLFYGLPWTASILAHCMGFGPCLMSACHLSGLYACTLPIMLLYSKYNLHCLVFSYR
jgi:hypothetical protein